MTNIIYKLSKRFPLTSGMTSRIEGRIFILYPMDRQTVINRTVNQLVRLYAIAIIISYILLAFSGMEPYMVAIVAVTIYFVENAYVQKQMDKMESELLGHMLKFIEAVKFKFQFDGMLEEAILDTVSQCDFVMSVHGQLIYEYLRESYVKDRCDYQEVSPNQFFLTFYSLCESVMKYGDKKTKEGSLFVKNLGYLKEDIHLELLKKRAVENAFMGLGSICIIPIFCIKPIEQWAVTNMPELMESYNSSTGILITISLAIVSIVIYQIVLHLKYPTGLTVGKKAWVKKLMDKQCIQNVNTWYMNRNIKTMIKLEKLLKSVAHPYNIAEYCVERGVLSIAVAIVCVVLALTIGLGWLSFALGVIGYLCSYYGKTVMLMFKQQLLLMERENEIIRFQSIILMLMHADRITVEQILLQMERFASGFKTQLEEISDKLSYKGMAVFKEYKDKTDFLPFNRIIDGFIACDDMYISRAFEDMESDRQYYIEKHKQENGYNVEQRSAVGKFLSFIPLCLVVIVKLIVPFVLEGMNQMAVSSMQL